MPLLLNHPPSLPSHPTKFETQVTQAWGLGIRQATGDLPTSARYPARKRKRTCNYQGCRTRNTYSQCRKDLLLGHVLSKLDPSQLKIHLNRITSTPATPLGILAWGEETSSLSIHLIRHDWTRGAVHLAVT